MATPASGTTAQSRRQSTRLLKRSGEGDLPTSGQLQRGGRELEAAIRSTNPPRQLPPITPGLVSSEVRPLNIPSVPAATGAAALGGTLDTGADQFTQELTRQREARQQDLGELGSLLVSEMQGAEGEASRTAREFAREGGVDDLSVELSDINNQILQEQVALQRQIERIEKNPEGKLAGAIDADIQKAERESIRKRADLSVVQMGIQGRYDSAKAIADRAVAVQVEQQKQRLDTLSFIYNENKDLFTTAEQREFETKQADRERAFEAEERNLQEISDLSISALQSGAPSSVVAAMRSAKTVAEAIEVGGGYVGLLQRQQAQASMNASRLAARKNLLELALAGDPEAVKELGYDPNNLPVTTEELIRNEDEYVRVTSDVERIEGLLANDVGLQTSSGALQSPAVTATFNVAGGILSYPSIKTKQQDFLSGASYVIDNLTFDKLVQLKEEGATFGALSDNELRTIGNAAGEISAMAIKENGTLIGFRGSEDKLREQLGVVQQGLEKAKDELNTQIGIDRSERDEITNIYYGSNR